MSVDSTNRWIRDAALEGAPEGLAVLADEQLDGRGRRDRRWVAPPNGALLCSMLFRPLFSDDAFHLLASAVGCAALEALEVLVGLEAGLKWPNDLVVGAKKLGGILAEVVPGAQPAVIVGIGCNLAFPPGWLPAGGAAEIGPLATTVEREAGRTVGRDEFAEALLDGVERRYAPLVSAGGRYRLLEEYRNRCTTLGTRIAVELDGGAIEGVGSSIGTDGRLIVTLDDGSTRALEVGDVVHLRTRGS